MTIENVPFCFGLASVFFETGSTCSACPARATCKPACVAVLKSLSKVLGKPLKLEFAKPAITSEQNILIHSLPKRVSEMVSHIIVKGHDADAVEALQDGLKVTSLPAVMNTVLNAAKPAQQLTAADIRGTLILAGNTESSAFTETSIALRSLVALELLTVHKRAYFLHPRINVKNSA